MENNFYKKVYSLVKQIPSGKVVSYGQIARAAGSPRASRIVGRALHLNPQPGVIPCHRVVNKDGRLAPGFAFGGTDAQARLLENEGVTIKNNHVDMSEYSYVFKDQ